MRYQTIAKRNLVHGAYYMGQCRNANIARWDGEKQHFVHWRTKFGSTFRETIKHLEDEQHYDVFLPLCEIAEPRPIPLESENDTGAGTAGSDRNEGTNVQAVQREDVRVEGQG